MNPAILKGGISKVITSRYRGNKFPSCCNYTGVSKNRGTPNSSILIGFSIIHHPFWGPTPIFGSTPIQVAIFVISSQSQSRAFLGFSVDERFVVVEWVTSVHQTVGGSLHSEDLRVKNRWHTSPKRWVLNKRWAIKINTFEGLLPLQYF